MIGSLFACIVGIIFAFVALAKNPTPGLINLTTVRLYSVTNITTSYCDID